MADDGDSPDELPLDGVPPPPLPPLPPPPGPPPPLPPVAPLAHAASPSSDSGEGGPAVDAAALVPLFGPDAPKGGAKGGPRGRGRGRPSRQSQLAALAGDGEGLHPLAKAAAAAAASASRDASSALVASPPVAPEREARLRLALPVGRTEHAALLRGPRDGLMPMPSFAGALSAASLLVRTGADDYDLESATVAREILAPRDVRLASTRSAADAAETSVKAYRLTSCRLSATIVCLEHVARAALEQAVTQMVPRRDLVHYTDFVMYDETPLPTRMSGMGTAVTSAADLLGRLAHARAAPAAPPPPRALPPAPHAPRGNMLQVRMGASQSLTVATNLGPQKVMQLIQRFSFVFRLGARLLAVVGDAPSPLCVIDSGTAECLKQALLFASTASVHSGLFAGATRMATHDRNAANLKCERSIAADRIAPGGSADSKTWQCEVHMTSTVFDRSMKTFESVVKGIIHVALSLRTGDNMGRLRECLAEEIQSRLRILYGRPPNAALLHKLAVVRLFARPGSAKAERRILLALCPNGDWRSRDIEFYVRPNGPCSSGDRAEILEHMVSGLLVALTAAQPRQYPRHRPGLA